MKRISTRGRQKEIRSSNILFFSEDRERECENETEQDAGRNGKIESKTAFTQKNVAWQLAETRDLVKKDGKDPHPHEDEAEKDQCFCEVAHAFSLRDFV
jgi:hypothetical protein